MDKDPLVVISTGQVVLRPLGRGLVPYRVTREGALLPIRGRNKKGHLVWRTYRTVEEARENLGLPEVAR
jgi:hypothetical protein